MRRSIVRRTAKWAALIMAAPLLLLTSYISAWLLFTWWTASGGALPPGRYTSFAYTRRGVIVTHLAFEPIHRYITSGWPGANLLAALGNEVLERSLSPALPPPEPEPPVVEDIDRLLMDIPN